MNRLVASLALALASCAPPGPSEPDPAEQAAPTDRAVEDPDGSAAGAPASLATLVLAAPPAPTPRALTAAIPSGSIEAIALTDDGLVAVSAGASGSMRLWPSLDGKREPVVVDARPAAQLAIGRDGSELVIAALDRAGQLELLRVTARGEPIGRITPAVARPLVEVHVLSRGILALRDDRAIASYDLHGAPADQLVAAPGQRIASIAARNGKALALIEEGERVRGRWIELAEQVKWGPLTPALPILADRVALSPDHRRVAGVTTDRQAVTIVELASGRQTSAIEQDDSHRAQVEAVCFTDADTIAAATAIGVRWWPELEDSPVSAQRFACGDRLVLASADAINRNDHTVPGVELALMRAPGAVKYLGHRIRALTELRATGRGWIASDGERVVMLDERFHTERYVTLLDPALGGQAPTRPVYLLDGRHALVLGDPTIQVLDLASGDRRELAPYAEYVQYEPTSHLLAFRTEHRTFEFWRYAPRTATFVLAASVADPASASGEYSSLALRSGSADVVATIGVWGRSKVVRAIELVADPATPGKLRPRARKAAGAAPAYRAPYKVPSPNGVLVAELGPQRITLHEGAKERWTIANPGAVDAVWSSAGELVLFGGGIARVDLATGALGERQCGWAFGLWDDEVDSAGDARMCDAL